MSTKPEKTSTGDPDLAAVVQNRLVEQLAESERQHRMLLNELPEVVLRLDREGHLLYVNDAWKTRFGFDLESSLGSSIHDFLHKDDWKKWDALVSCDHSAVSAEFDRVLRLVNNGGRIYLVDARTRRLNSGEIVGSLEDVTDRHQLETERLRAQKLESIGRLAGGLAHDFNNLLTVILGNVNLGQRRLSTQEIELKELDLAARACNQAAALTKQMLAFSKGGEPNRQPGDLGSLVRDGVELYLRGSNIQVEMEVEPNLRAVEMDSSQIHQVLNNLVINAIQAMPSGGLLQVKVQNCSFALPTDAGPVRGVSVSVRDDGVGIPKENLEHIFEPYFTTKETGNGLGLTSAYWIIQRHEGLFEVDSTPGVGTLFRFTLRATNADDDAEQLDRNALTSQRGHILVMDDDRAVRQAVVAMLESLGHTAGEASNGETCSAAYLEAMESGNPFDLVIIDLTIAGGHDGVWTINRLREIDPEVRAIVASGYSNAPVVSDHRRYGFHGVLAKPLMLTDLDRVITAVLTHSPSNR